MWSGNNADQSFGGGGFSMAGGGFNSPTENQQKRRSANKSQSLMPVTVAQLVDARAGEDGTYFVNDRELNHVTVVGIIRSITDTSTNIVYELDDLTGPFLTVRRFLQQNEDSELEQMRRSECREGTYVRVTGHLREVQDRRIIVAFTVVPVTDHNELTFHMLDVIHAHLRLEKMVNQGDTSALGMSDMMGSGAGRNDTAAASSTMQHFTPVQQQVLNAIIGCRDSQGADIHDLFRQLRTHGITDDAVRSAVEFLSQEGHIYSTIDDDHYKSTDEY